MYRQFRKDKTPKANKHEMLKIRYNPGNGKLKE